MGCLGQRLQDDGMAEVGKDHLRARQQEPTDPLKTIPSQKMGELPKREMWEDACSHCSSKAFCHFWT